LVKGKKVIEEFVCKSEELIQLFEEILSSEIYLFDANLEL